MGGREKVGEVVYGCFCLFVMAVVFGKRFVALAGTLTIDPVGLGKGEAYSLPLHLCSSRPLISLSVSHMRPFFSRLSHGI